MMASNEGHFLTNFQGCPVFCIFVPSPPPPPPKSAAEFGRFVLPICCFFWDFADSFCCLFVNE